MPRLIVIRGPSGAGKSTVARQLFEAVGTPVALIDLDYFRFAARNASDDARIEYRLAEAAIGVALGQHFDVIFEGNFRPLPDGGLPLRLLDFASTAVFAFYLDVSLEESLDRHAGRSDGRITAQRMVELYPAARPIEALNEVALAEAMTVDDKVKAIRTASGL
jgi:hypothetical protein